MPAPESARRPNVDIILTGRAAERERRRQELLAERTRKQRLEAIGTTGGWIVVIVIAALVAAVVSGALAWLAVWLWTNLPL